ncbi:hypothetical protein NLG97_g2729 [Lecanicillium saksenae]|uniref:Uncharacterized protein n=1 Tax=Lecanicillium saksenae TaxID=468837 RepID=A0ACC1R1B9_9HYPO|nr:hypothetical protein NLG97_g2729 [Lecanicillium saksenae]
MFTDISPAFFLAAKERFREYWNISFKPLDITKDPLSQGFEPAAFDLIVAANVLYATPCLKETLTNVCKLLHLSGKLLLEELYSETKFTNFVTGILPGWWDGGVDGRPDEPYISLAQWDVELQTAGFNGVDDFTFDAAPLYYVNSYIFVTPYATPSVARTIRSEFGIAFATCEVDGLHHANIGLVVDVFEKFQRHIDQKAILAEQEYIIHDGVINVGRMFPFSSSGWLHSITESEVNGKELEVILHGETCSTEPSKLHQDDAPAHGAQNVNVTKPDINIEIHSRQANGAVCSLTDFERPLFRPDACYLLVGGLGGLGSALARWMVEHNARNLIFLSRSGGENASDKRLLMELESQSCHVSVIKGSISTLSDVQWVMSSTSVPLKGIFNLSMVLHDASLLKMSLDEWNTATEPKVQGTWNLHQTSLSHTLDFFVLFSSMCGIFGMPGQANYAAANAFMDAFVQYRHQCGLPASVLDLGAVEGVGHVAENPHILERSSWLETVRLSQRELFEAVKFAILVGAPHVSTGAGFINVAQIITTIRATSQSQTLDISSHFLDGRFSSYIGSATEPNGADELTSGNELSEFLKSSAEDPAKLKSPSSVEFISTQITKWVFDLLIKPVEDESEIDISRSLADVSFDSLATVEMRTWWRRTFGLEISVLEIMSFTSFAALGEYVVMGLVRRLE